MIKVCSICGVGKLEEEDFYFHSRDGVYRTDCKKCFQAKVKRNADNRRQPGDTRSQLWKFGLTIEEWRERRDSQGGVCAICRRLPTKKKLVLQVDHCHTTGNVRGLLCNSCNTVLGLFEEDPNRFVRAIEYLTVDEPWKRRLEK